jgi:hypothetical protein
MLKKQFLLIAAMAQLVVRHTFKTIVHEFETAGRRSNALVSTFIDFF